MFYLNEVDLAGNECEVSRGEWDDAQGVFDRHVAQTGRDKVVVMYREEAQLYLSIGAADVD